MTNDDFYRDEGRYGRIEVPAWHSVWSSSRGGSAEPTNGAGAAMPAKPAEPKLSMVAPRVITHGRRLAQASPYRQSAKSDAAPLSHGANQLKLDEVRTQPMAQAPSKAAPRRQVSSAIPAAKSAPQARGAQAMSQTKARGASSTNRHQPVRSREAILRQAAIVRAEARRRAEAAASAELERQLAAVRQTSTAEVTQPMMLTQFEPVPAGAAIGGGTAVPSYAPVNPLAKLASSKVTINFNFNKAKMLRALRYALVITIIGLSGYLAYDTYMTNKAVRATISGSASAASISGTNPATADQTAVSQEDKLAYTVPADQPRFISIPAIGLSKARVMSVGVNSKGNIDTPSNLNDTAWYDGSAKPGQTGAVFIDGHTSFNRNLDAAFNDLGKLKAGDTITIEKGDGSTVNYVVRSQETAAADKVDMGKALNPIDGATKGLTLMTCAGKFNYRTQTADKRLIVYAVEV